MKLFLPICLLLFAFPSKKANNITLAITDCNVITMTSNKVLKHRTILVADDKIVDILPASQWRNTDNIKTIDGRGRYVMPALGDMHIHVNQYSNWVFPLLLSHGVTTIRVMSGSDMVLKWRDSVNSNHKLAPDIHCASQLLDGDPPFWGNLHEGPIVRNTDSVEQIVLDQINKGYEFIKVYNRLNKDVYKEIRKACFKNGIRLTGHIPVELDKGEMFTETTGEIEHLSGYAKYVSMNNTISKEALAKNSDMAIDMELASDVSRAKMKIAAEKTRTLDIWNCPTLIVHGVKTDSLFCKNLADSKLSPQLTPVLGWWKSQGYTMKLAEQKLWEFKKEMTKELNRQNALLLAGSDSPVPWVVPGLSLHQELEYLVEAGLSNYDALKTATVNPALWFGKNYNKGTIEKNKGADLIILSANPLDDISNTQKIVDVIYKGKIVKRQ